MLLSTEIADLRVNLFSKKSMIFVPLNPLSGSSGRFFQALSQAGVDFTTQVLCFCTAIF